MGTRFSLGKGFTIGASGLRYGRSIPGVKRGYVSVGRSGTLITGAGVRHWQGSRRGSGGPRTVPHYDWAQLHESAVTLPATIKELQEAYDWVGNYLAGLDPAVRAAMPTIPEGRKALHDYEVAVPAQLAESRAMLVKVEALLASEAQLRRAAKHPPGEEAAALFFGLLIILMLVLGALLK